MKIGFIGLGIMGSRMAANLQRTGHQLVVYNRTRAKAQKLIEAGAEFAATPADLANSVETIVTMLSDPQALDTIALHPETGLLNGPSTARSARLWIDCSTVDPASSLRMEKHSNQSGLQFLEAPVAGSKEPAAKGELLFFTGGPQEVLKKAQPLLDCMGKKIIHAGSVGKGAALKLVINVLLAQSVTAYSEALALGTSLGLSQSQLLKILPNTPVAAPVLGALGNRFQEFNPDDVHFPLRHLHKDLHLATEAAYTSGQPVPLLAGLKEIIASTKNTSYAEADFSAIFHHIAGQTPG